MLEVLERVNTEWKSQYSQDVPVKYSGVSVSVLGMYNFYFPAHYLKHVAQ